MKFGFYSCMSGVNWGGSETLWSMAAAQLLDQGHQVTINYKWWPKEATQLTDLAQAGAEVWHRDRRVRNKIASGLIGSWRIFKPNDGTDAAWLRKNRPDLLLITIGFHPDRVALADECQELGIRYAINLQCASSSVFVNSSRLDEFRNAYRNAERVFVMSQENLDKLEVNLALRLENVEQVCNPFCVSWDCEPSWPDEEAWRLACVGRIHFASKGQDLLVQVMRQPKWRERNLTIGLVGKNQGNERQLVELIELYGLQDKFEFVGFRHDIEEVWRDYHGLILPSRYEGAALVVTEAMLSHRMVVSTDTGRNRELIDDNQTGFIADAPTLKHLDDALERAWQRRASWREMGLAAGRAIRERFNKDPASRFKERLLALAEGRHGSAPPITPPAENCPSAS